MMLRTNSFSGQIRHHLPMSPPGKARRIPSSVDFSPRSAVVLFRSESAADTTSRLLRRSRSDTDLTAGNVRRRIRRPASPPAAVAEEAVDVEYSAGGGMAGNGWKAAGGRSGGGGEGDCRRMGEYYRRLLQSDPGNQLLLMNYGKYLQEVERDLVAAEEYYGRAILAAGIDDEDDDSEVFSRYGELLWKTSRDADRSAAYFERAVESSPDNCFVLASYARFLWDAEGEEGSSTVGSPPLIESF